MVTALLVLQALMYGDDHLSFASLVHKKMYCSITNLMLFFSGSYFCYDTPGSLADNFKGDSHLNTSQFALLYSIYSWPNVILCFIGGYLIDRFVYPSDLMESLHLL